MKDGRREEQNKKKTLLFEIILVLSLLLVSLLFFLLTRGVKPKNEPASDVLVGGILVDNYTGAYAEVTVNGEIYARYALVSDGEFVLNGGTNVLVIESGRAYMRSATCPDKTCVHSRAISKVGETVVCLPNRVTVSVIGDGGVDLVS